MLPFIMASLILMNTTGPIMLDGNALAYVHLNGTNAYFELPKIPGVHIVTYGTNEAEYHIFDVSCHTQDLFSCNITGRASISLDYFISCENSASGTLNLKKGQNQVISAGENCQTARLKVGDYYQEFNFTRVFRNFIRFDGSANITVSKNGEAVLEKFGQDYMSFPELSPGKYKISSSKVRGLLIIEPLKTAVYGYALSMVLVLSVIALLWLG